MKYRKIKISKRNPIFIILDNIRSLYNVGAIFRTADGMLAEKIFLCGITAIPPRREIEKTSLGAHETVPWEYRDTALKAVKELKDKGIQIVALEITNPTENYTNVEFKYPTALVIGHEINGISEEIFNYVDTFISIPMLGQATSLNVATALGIAGYQMLHNLTQNKNVKT